MRKIKLSFITVCLAGMLSLPCSVLAEWTVETHSSDENTGITVPVAYTKNQDGYSLEIYQDSVNAVRGRFTLPGLLRFMDKSCPTYQIDRNVPVNRSINEALCLSGGNWAEFILGYNTNQHITSPSLLSIMNGITITVRFKLENGDYRDTTFSLDGSKRAMITIFGGDVTVSAR